MENRGSKIVAVIALCVAVVGVTLGFAAFSNSLNIKPSADVAPDASTFNVDFSSSNSSLSTDPVTPTKSPGSLVATNATISNEGDPTISGLSATFTAPGQSVTYTFYANNIGEYNAYLNSITFANASSGDSFKVCTPGGGTTASLVTAACEDITVSVKVGSETETTSSQASITGHSLAKGAYEEIVVKIDYAAGGDRADGPFDVDFGNIALTYSSVD